MTSPNPESGPIPESRPNLESGSNPESRIPRLDRNPNPESRTWTEPRTRIPNLNRTPNPESREIRVRYMPRLHRVSHFNPAGIALKAF